VQIHVLQNSFEEAMTRYSAFLIEPLMIRVGSASQGPNAVESTIRAASSRSQASASTGQPPSLTESLRDGGSEASSELHASLQTTTSVSQDPVNASLRDQSFGCEHAAVSIGLLVGVQDQEPPGPAVGNLPEAFLMGQNEFDEFLNSTSASIGNSHRLPEVGELDWNGLLDESIKEPLFAPLFTADDGNRSPSISS
jgi:hypothetical protein